MPSSRLYWLLMLLAGGVFASRLAVQGPVALRLAPETEFRFAQTIEARGAAGDFELEIFVPASSSRLQVRDEKISAGRLQFRTDDSEGGRRLVVSGGRGELPEAIHYEATIRQRALTFDLPEDLDWNDVMARTDLDSTVGIARGHEEIRLVLARLFDVPDSVATEATAAEWRERLAAAGVGPVAATRAIFAYCRDEIRPATFSGSTDALTALRLREASCGGKSRLMAAMCRTLGIPARLVGGVIMGEGRKKRPSHVWVEAGLGDQWVPYDPLNDHRERSPAHYLPLYLGDLPLIRHSRGLSFDYGFAAPAERVPVAWTLSSDEAAVDETIPLLQRRHFSIIVLAPFALLLTLFARQVVGLDSIGVFFPVLLGFCVTQIGWMLSTALLVAALVFGGLFRLVLSRVNLLHVPRAGILISFVLILLLGLTVSFERLGVEVGPGALVLPVAALVMAVERLSNTIMDGGFAKAIKLLVETLVLAVASALLFMQPLFKLLTVSFPEVLLVVIAEMIMIGQYRGLRLTELWRFRSLRREKP